RPPQVHHGGAGERPPGADPAPQPDVDPELFADLPHRSLGGPLPRLHLPPGELPAPGHRRGLGAACGQHPGRTVEVVDEGDGGDDEVLRLRHTPILHPGVRATPPVPAGHGPVTTGRALFPTRAGVWWASAVPDRSAVRRPPVGGTMKNRKVGALATAAALALVLTSCADSARDTDDPAEADNGGDATQTEGAGGEAPAGDATFVFGAAGAPTTFDPFYASDGE